MLCGPLRHPHIFIAHLGQTSGGGIRICTVLKNHLMINRATIVKGRMKKALLLFGMILMSGTTARADIHHRMTTSAALQVDAAQTSVTRAGNTFSISGNNVTTTVTPSGGSAAASLGGISAVSNTGVATFTVPDATQTTAGNAFSFTTSLTTGDAISTSAPSTGAVSAYSNQFSSAAGSAGDLAGQVTSAHGFATGDAAPTAGGAGTTMTSQFVSELTVR